MTPIRGDWSLHRKGPADEARHREKIREALRANLVDLISEEAVITSDGERLIRVPLRSLKEYRFRFDERSHPHVGQGRQGAPIGHVLARDRGSGAGSQAGHLPGVDIYEAEVTLDELEEVLFEELELPRPEPRPRPAAPAPRPAPRTVSRRGPAAALHLRRTLLANLRRHAREGRPALGPLREDDLRYHAPKVAPSRRTGAAVLLLRDASASMGEFKKYLTRALAFWVVRFLRSRYEGVALAFIVHHTEAREVGEEDFFRLAESGGTRVSSAYRLALQLTEERFDPGAWNVYALHFTDGENWGEADNEECRRLVMALLERCRLFGYCELGGGDRPSSLWQALAGVTDRRFAMVRVRRREDVYPALRRLFPRRDGEG